MNGSNDSKGVAHYIYGALLQSACCPHYLLSAGPADTTVMECRLRCSLLIECVNVECVNVECLVFSVE